MGPGAPGTCFGSPRASLGNVSALISSENTCSPCLLASPALTHRNTVGYAEGLCKKQIVLSHQSEAYQPIPFTCVSAICRVLTYLYGDGVVTGGDAGRSDNDGSLGRKRRRTDGFQGQVLGGLSIPASSSIHLGIMSIFTIMPRGLGDPCISLSQPICKCLFPNGYCSN